MFVIVRAEDGRYVTPRGSESSYTRSLQCARVFRTREEAESERCPENERIVDVDNILSRGLF